MVHSVTHTPRPTHGTQQARPFTTREQKVTYVALFALSSFATFTLLPHPIHWVVSLYFAGLSLHFLLSPVVTGARMASRPTMPPVSPTWTMAGRGEVLSPEPYPVDTGYMRSSGSLTPPARRGDTRRDRAPLLRGDFPISPAAWRERPCLINERHIAGVAENPADRGMGRVIGLFQSQPRRSVPPPPPSDSSTRHPVGQRSTGRTVRHPPIAHPRGGSSSSEYEHSDSDEWQSPHLLRRRRGGKG